MIKKAMHISTISVPLTSSLSYPTPRKLKKIQKILEEFGFKVHYTELLMKVAETAEYRKPFWFARYKGKKIKLETEKQYGLIPIDIVAENFEEALKYDVIWCWQGGFGSSRLIRFFKTKKFEGKTIIGFSDNTSIMTLVLKNGGNAIQLAGFENLYPEKKENIQNVLDNVKKLIQGEEVELEIKAKNRLPYYEANSMYSGNLTCYLMTVQELGWTDLEYDISLFEDIFNESSSVTFVGDYIPYFFCIHLLSLHANKRKMLAFGKMQGIRKDKIKISLKEYYKGKFAYGIDWGHNGKDLKIVPSFKKGEGECLMKGNKLKIRVKFKNVEKRRFITQPRLTVK